MRIFGLDISWRKKAANPVYSMPGNYWQTIFDGTGGYFQQDYSPTSDSMLANYAVFSCLTLISSDIAKLRPKLVKRDSDGIWSEISDPRYSQVLMRPNHFQNHIQFKEWWMLSKLQRGNTYGLKERNLRGDVIAIHLLDTQKVTPLVTEFGDIFYQLNTDNLAGLEETVTVPSSEVIHDRWNCLFHPLVGLSPLYAAGASASLGLKIQNNSSNFFTNNARPSGVLTAPGQISSDTAARLKADWVTKFTGDNSGKVAVLGDGLKFEPMTMTAVDSQLIEQLKWSAEVVCAAFHVPAYKAGVGSPPSYNNIQSLEIGYFTQCLQILIESFEYCMDEALGLSDGIGTELDLDGLLRMDSKTQIETLVAAVGGSLKTPNEGRKALDLKPVKGGDTIYMQQQNYSLAALDERDKMNPLAAPAQEPAVQEPDNDEISDEEADAVMSDEEAA